MTKEQATRMAKMQAVMCGGIFEINGKKLTGKNGYMYLDYKKVENIDGDIPVYVDVDDAYVNQLMKEELCGVIMKDITYSTNSEKSMFQAIQRAIGTYDNGIIGTQTISRLATNVDTDCFLMTLALYKCPTIIGNDLLALTRTAGLTAIRILYQATSHGRARKSRVRYS